MNSHSSGCTERVKMSRWSWRSLRSSAQPIAPTPSRSRVRPASPALPQATRKSAGGADTPEAPSFPDAVSCRGGEDVLERRRVVLLAELVRRPLGDERPEIEDRDAVALSFRLLHLVRRHE